MRGLRPIVCLATLLMGVMSAYAQNSIFTQSQKNVIQARNSASGFSTDRLRKSVVNSSVPRYNYANVNRGLLSNAYGSSQPRSKPFSSYGGGPSVTPYLALDSPFTSSASTYYSLIRPQQEQQKLNEQMQQRNLALQKQLNDVAARGPYDIHGSEYQAPTGHSAVYMNYGGYYPVPQAAPKRK